MIYKDQMQRDVELPTIPRRIISLVPSQTELLVSLGLEDYIVGVTKFCVHPIEIRKEKSIVGGTKQIHLDKIQALNPDIILCNKEENTKEIVEALEEKYPVHVSDISTVEEAMELIHQYGMIFNIETTAKKMILAIGAEVKSFLDFIKNKPQKKVAYFIWRKPWMVAGKGTFIDYLLKMNGFINIYGHEERYPEITEEKLASVEDIDLILLSSEPFPFSEKHIQELEKIIAGAKAVLVDGEYFSWYGSRLTKAFTYFRTLH